MARKSEDERLRQVMVLPILTLVNNLTIEVSNLKKMVEDLQKIHFDTVNDVKPFANAVAIANAAPSLDEDYIALSEVCKRIGVRRGDYLARAEIEVGYPKPVSIGKVLFLTRVQFAHLLNNIEKKNKAKALRK
ncbi:hypothetical protein CKF54_03695 [Psittacicella hinzii]|uniref:Uncharacterized protein n=1 Tax=Psittacicella hinzii TaxID=2028575 RepID=A0A3A1Y5M7_9GAMM|nr:hypothetical protein [Psittacicella hinzii]RIY32915.1 hypothetical protein CKF54_03695 [Psittacicella hinzii]